MKNKYAQKLIRAKINTKEFNFKNFIFFQDLEIGSDIDDVDLGVGELTFFIDEATQIINKQKTNEIILNILGP